MNMNCKIINNQDQTGVTTTINTLGHESNILFALHNLDPKNYLIPHQALIKDLKYSQTTELKDQVVKINYTQDKPNIIVDGTSYEVEIPLESKTREKFDRKYKGQIFYCICSIRYTKIWGIFSLHNIKPLDIQDADKKWCSHLSKFPSLITRIDEVIKILELNPDTLLIREKIVQLIRILALIEERYILMDYGPAKRGKTTTYKKLGLHGKSFANTRASIVINNSNKQLGDFFNVLSDTFIAEEVQNLSDPEFWTFLQTYADGNRGDIVFSSTDVRQFTTSCCLLGNPEKKIDYIKIFADKINIFEGTKIPIKTGEAGGAKLSRIDAMIYSGGTRNISNNMILTNNIERFPILIFKQALLDLRKKHIDINKLICKLNLPILGDKRIEISVYKTLEGLLKLLMPELCTNDNLINNNPFYSTGINYLYQLALEIKKVVENTVNILSEKENPSTIQVNSEKFSFLNIYNPWNTYYYTPHRIIIQNNMTNMIIKQPLDIVGIKQNEDEAKILNLLQSRGYYSSLSFNGIILQHNSIATFANIISSLPEVYVPHQILTQTDTNGNITAKTISFDGKNPGLFDFNGTIVQIDNNMRPLLPAPNGQLLTFEQYNGFSYIYDNKGISRLKNQFGNQIYVNNFGQVKLLFEKRKYWNRNILYNYLTGEEELQSKGNSIRNLIFYDLEIN